MDNNAAVVHYKERYERLKKEAQYIKESMDHAWSMLTAANKRLVENGLKPITQPPKKAHDYDCDA